MELSSTYAESFVQAVTRHRRHLLTALCVLLGLCATQAFAQEATLVGTISDSSGAVVPNAAITITNMATGQVRKLASNEAGQYVASALPIGNYDVKVQASGFSLADTTGVVLNVGDRRRVDFALKVGATQTSDAADEGRWMA